MHMKKCQIDRKYTLQMVSNYSTYMNLCECCETEKLLHISLIEFGNDSKKVCQYYVPTRRFLYLSIFFTYLSKVFFVLFYHERVVWASQDYWEKNCDSCLALWVINLVSCAVLQLKYISTSVADISVNMKLLHSSCFQEQLIFLYESRKSRVFLS